MSKTTILIDADVLAFESSIVAQENIQWEEELWTVHADMAVAKERVIGRIEQFKDLLKADEVVLALSDRANSEGNYSLSTSRTEGSQYYLSS